MRLLDSDLIVERRLALGLSQPALARAVGRSPAVVAKMEAGENHESLTLDLLTRLSEVLGVPVSAIVRLHGEPENPTPDDLKLEAMLAHAGKGLTAKTLATATGWSLERTHDGLEMLRRRLRHSGVRLVHHAGRWRLRGVTGVLTSDEVQRLERASVSTDRLSLDVGRVLLAIVRGDVDAQWLRQATESQRIAAARLQRLGYAQMDRGKLRVTKDVRFSLGLDR